MKGFTLIELIIAVAMVAILSTITIANFRKAERQKRLDLAVDLSVNGIRNAQNFGLTAKQISSSLCQVGGINDKAPKSYIIVFNTNSTLYGEDKCNNVIAIESYQLPLNTRIQASGLKINGNSVSNLQVKFSPPFAVMTVSSDTTLGQGPFTSFTQATVTLENTETGSVQTVTIDGVSGKIGD